jgi:hypothetical protein
MVAVVLGVFMGCVRCMWGVVGVENLCYIGQGSLKNQGSNTPQIIGFKNVF